MCTGRKTVWANGSLGEGGPTGWLDQVADSEVMAAHCLAPRGGCSAGPADVSGVGHRAQAVDLSACQRVYDNGQALCGVNVPRELIATARSTGHDPACAKTMLVVFLDAECAVADALAERMWARFEEYQRDMSGFITVPWDNNQAERDLRMVKAQQRNSNSGRTLTGARRLTRVRYLILAVGKHETKPPHRPA